MSLCANWQLQAQCSWLQSLPKEPMAWLTYPGSLTECLENCFGSELLFQLDTNTWQATHSNEQNLLALNNETAWVRSISFNINQQPLILARTVLPKSSCQNPQLNPRIDQPIGKILFKEPSLIRHAFEFKKISPTDQYLAMWPHDFSSYTSIVARRSIIIFQQLPLLITELFMPQLLNHLTKYHPSSQFDSCHNKD